MLKTVSIMISMKYCLVISTAKYYRVALRLNNQFAKNFTLLEYITTSIKTDDRELSKGNTFSTEAFI